MNSKQRFDELDICKGFAILAVLWNHSFILHPVNIHDLPWCQHAANINSTFYLVLFFMVSGYLLSLPKDGLFLASLGKKAKRLLVPYFAFSAVNLLMKLAMPSLVNKQVESIGTYLEKLILLGGEMWFLYSLFIITAIWSLLLKYLHNKLSVLVLFALLIGIDIMVGGGINNGYDLFLYRYFIHYSPYFLMGFYLRRCEWFRNFISSNKSFFISTILFIPLCLIFVSDLFEFRVFKLILKYIGCWFVWSLSFKLLNIDVLKKVLSYVGKNSLGYYWLNGFALVVARTFVVSIMHISFSPAIAVSVWILCVMGETIAIKIIKKIPRVGMFVGV